MRTSWFSVLPSGADFVASRCVCTDLPRLHARAACAAGELRSPRGRAAQCVTHIVMRIERTVQRLQIEIEDYGDLQRSPNKRGVGLDNLEGRLRSLYGLRRVSFVLALLFGMPPQILLMLLSLNLLYQFWLHASRIPCLGPLEWIFVTPCAYRRNFHHASNIEYRDGNYGGVLIVFDQARSDMDLQ